MQSTESIKLNSSWKSILAEEFSKDYMKNLKKFLADELAKGKTIYPHGNDIFAALDATNFENVKVIIIGQDPYHGPGQAHGLCFSVKPDVAIPPSLKNIYKELNNDLGINAPNHGHLQAWAEQGVLLLNTVLTVEKGKAGSHHNKGWEIFTDAIIDKLNHKQENLVFILWGSPAQKKGKNIDRSKHLVLTSVHPSPLSAHRGFFGNHHFSTTNVFLQKHDLRPINWSLPSIQ